MATVRSRLVPGRPVLRSLCWELGPCAGGPLPERQGRVWRCVASAQILMKHSSRLKGCITLLRFPVSFSVTTVLYRCAFQVHKSFQEATFLGKIISVGPEFKTTKGLSQTAFSSLLDVYSCRHSQTNSLWVAASTNAGCPCAK